NYTRDLPAPVEGYKKDDSADFCAERLRTLVQAHKQRDRLQSVSPAAVAHRPPQVPYTFAIRTGQIIFDHALCANCETKVCVKVCAPEILKVENDVPILAISREEAKGGGCT